MPGPDGSEPRSGPSKPRTNNPPPASFSSAPQGSSHLQLGLADAPVSGQGIFGSYSGAVLPGLHVVEGGQTSTGGWLAGVAPDAQCNCIRCERGIQAWVQLCDHAWVVPCREALEEARCTKAHVCPKSALHVFRLCRE